MQTSKKPGSSVGPRDSSDTAERYRDRWRWDKTFPATHCVDCYPGNCPYKVFVRDGKIVAEEQAATFPVIDPNVPDLNPMGCQKGAAWSKMLDSPERVLHPLKRAGERGEAKWEQVTWDKALTEIADHMLDAIEDGGPETIIREGTPAEGGLLTTFPFGRLLDMVGGLTPDVNGVINDFSTGIYLTYGKFDPASSIDDFFYSDFIMYTHMNPVYTQISAYHFTAEARYRGAEIVLVAPDVSPSHTHADYHVPVKPGTDAALGLSMAQVIIEEGLYEAPFVKEQTDLPLLVRLDTRQFLRQSDIREGGRDDQFYVWDTVSDSLAEVPLATLDYGEVDPVLTGAYTAELADGQRVEVLPVFELLKYRLKDYTPEKAQAMCDVHPDTTRMLARKLASKRGTIFCGGTSFKYFHSDLMVRSYLLVLGLTGNWGRKGTGPGEWSVAGFDGPFIYGGKEKPGLEETRRILEMREAAIQMFKDQDPTRTDEMANIELMRAMVPQMAMVPAAFFWYYHCGYKDNWNRKEWSEPTMQRDFDEYLDESLERGWWQGRPGPDLTPRVYFEVGGNAMRRTRGGQNQLLDSLWANLKCAVTVDWRMNTTGLFSDYFLPVAHHFEKVAFMFPTPQLMNLTFSDKAVEPPPDVKNEVEIGVLLAEKIEERAKARGIAEYSDSQGTQRTLAGLADRYTKGGVFRDAETIANEWIVDSAESGNFDKGFNLEKLREKGYQRFKSWGIGAMAHSQAADIEENETHTAFRYHVENKLPFPTLTRRAQFYIDHEWFLEAGEELPCHKDDPRQGGRHEFFLTSGHPRWSIHSMNMTNNIIQNTHRGEPFVMINPDDAAAKAIENGVPVRLHNDVASIELAAKLSPSVKPGQVILYNGFEPYQHKAWLGQSEVEPGMVKWLHLAGGYGHLKYRPWHWQPVPTDRGVSVDIEPLNGAAEGAKQ